MSDESVAGRGASLFSRSMSCGNEGDERVILPIVVLDLVSLLTFVSSFAYLGTCLLIPVCHPSLYTRARTAGRERALPGRGL
jgi:hypothetical protein